MGRNFLLCDRERDLEMPRDVREWLPPEHLCWKVLDVVGELDLSAFESGYRTDGQGGAAYPPANLVALILYCYSKGVRSTRRIEQSCWDDVGCRIITANRRVDHSTIARFVGRHRAALKSMFVQVLALCDRHGLVDLSAVAVDGSPMDANASRDSNRRLHRLEAIISQCEGEIDALLEDALEHARTVEADDFEGTESGTGSDGWPRLSRLCDRLTRARSARDKVYDRALPSPGEIRIKVEAAERMVARAKERLAAETAAHQEKLRKYEARAAADLTAGRRGANGRPPVSMEHKTALVRQRARLVKARAWLERARNPRPVPSPESRACLSDPDSRLMLSKRGGYLQGYNLQLACARNQLLLAIEIQDSPSDMTALVPMVTQIQRNCIAAGIVNEVQAWLADCGYASAANFEALAGLPLLVAVAREGSDSGPVPQDKSTIPAGQREMADRLDTPAGRTLYKRRGALVEPGFAQLFQRFGRHLNYRSTDRVDTEIKLLGTVHNLNELLNHTAETRS
ncbi:transposase (plasmid) [Streptomyces sp. NBC_01136]|uniref:transposase n=1 Tax=unclassified Streptomyces TaxID=2593676 RepID=UPI003249E823|nr:transposase [Streptomyces sp. NBC_01136]